MDASFTKGMINKPDIHHVAVINRWILAAIKLFNFILRHVPALKMPATDGLSRREKSSDDPDEDSDAEEWLENKLESSLTFLGSQILTIAAQHPSIPREPVYANTEPITSSLPYTDETRAKDEHLKLVRHFLSALSLPSELDQGFRTKIIKDSTHYFVLEGRLYRRDRNGRHQFRTKAVNRS